MKPGKRSRRALFQGALKALVAADLAALATRRAVAADSYTLRMSMPTASDAAWNVSAGHWAAAVARRSNGRLNIEIYPSSQLANQQESVRGLTTGLVDLTFQPSANFEVFVPELQVLQLPFLAKNAQAGFRVVDGPIGDYFFSALAAKGILGLFWSTAGFRQFETATKVLRAPDDMRGLRFRIQGGSVSVAMYQAVGAVPVTMDFNEVYVGLTQHTIDGLDTSPDGILSQKLYGAIGHMAMSNHTMPYFPIAASKGKIESLPSDLQRILIGEATAIKPSWRAATLKASSDAVDALKAKGVTVNEVDYLAFRKAMDPVYASIQQRFGADLVQRVLKSAV